MKGFDEGKTSVHAFSFGNWLHPPFCWSSRKLQKEILIFLQIQPREENQKQKSNLSRLSLFLQQLKSH